MSSSTAANQVRASHILIKHQGSRRKASWKDPEGRLISATTRDSAVSQLKLLRDDIVSGKAKFNDVASRYSDCSSAKRGGDLGPFGRGQMQRPFEDATYNLKVGEISDIVDTDSGVHIIMRTGSKTHLISSLFHFCTRKRKGNSMRQRPGVLKMSVKAVATCKGMHNRSHVA
ncbi:hypothetical protein V6N12_022029 [Hibiscus sabdariffa]|uniref:Peptidyl-prolyl cis-trans isomerase n=1 Tax=Hibiscus sabdariffa TaxID=183260 RepID=A0ABR2FTS4_9ROSI